MFKIMIVEDDVKMREIILENIIKWGFQGYYVENYSGVFDDFVKYDPHLVLMDINLAAYDGYYWCGKIREISKVPIIFISSRIMISEFMYGSKEAYNEAYNKATQIAIELTNILKASGNLFTIEGSDHMKFTDISLFIGNSRLRELIGIGGKTAPERCLEITKALTAGFFDEHLKGEDKHSFKSLVQRYPELKNVDLK